MKLVRNGLALVILGLACGLASGMAKGPRGSESTADRVPTVGRPHATGDDRRPEVESDDHFDGGPRRACVRSPGAGLRGEGDHEADEDAVPLKEAKLNIEHNATDEDTGFQGFIDSEGWKQLDITGPNGVVLSLRGRGALRSLGLTELFFETVEPENADVPLEDLLAMLPEGEYEIEGPTPDGGWTEGTAVLTHDIPAGPVLMSPAAGAVVPPSNLVMRWGPVTKTITGRPVTIVSYQLIVEKDESPHPHAIGKRGMSLYLPPSVTSLTVPNEFLEPGTLYKWEVLAIEESGNQTLSSSEFSTQ